MSIFEKVKEFFGLRSFGDEVRDKILKDVDAELDFSPDAESKCESEEQPKKTK